MREIEVENVVRLHTSEATLEVGTDADTGSHVEIRTPDKRSNEWYGEVRLSLSPDIATALAHAILKVAGTLEDKSDA